MSITDPNEGLRYPENRNSEGYRDPTYLGGTKYERRKTQEQMLSLAEQVDMLKTENAALKRKLEKAKSKRNELADRCLAWESALNKLDRAYTQTLRKKGANQLEELQYNATAYGLALACAILRRTVENTYTGAPSRIKRQFFAKQSNESRFTGL